MAPTRVSRVAHPAPLTRRSVTLCAKSPSYSHLYGIWDRSFLYVREPSRRGKKVVSKLGEIDATDKSKGSEDSASPSRSPVDQTQAALPPDAMKLFSQAQQSMLVLNESRMKALEELKAAKKQIAALQVELDGVKRELAQARSTTTAPQAPAEAPPPPAAPAEPTGGTEVVDAPTEATPVAKEQVLQPEEQQQQPEPEPEEPPPEPVAPRITIIYRTGWHDAFVHCNVDGRGWTSSPGIRMSGSGDNKEVVLEGRTAEFVLNNGGDDWDKPDPYSSGEPKNYTVDAPGTYVLARGTLKRQDG
mmetsp:Transcript_19334/g.46097  ORF Transcript_19334/g.46097 Transcript_19334/m.46097 type:complete len:302 (-) Transcript_19334:295-1200(-)